ncbi:hypothetical protein NHP21005_09570 [Helicobacter sp. NHP21005]|uniref:hypothetical protein n=1 Tax=Helicobacter felistomachi TaxID=3040201 RepID=UPI002573CEC3|nr:hypothetical protein [Helicobacter sp. NHP21005]BEG57269.1 hypothetical protein NHP21005_09570 [Helicobacter sp. NHP21005]
MGNISSINFKPTKNAVQLNHNDRSIAPNYLLPQEVILKVGGGVEVDRSAQEALALRTQIIKKAMDNYFQYRGQKFRAKSYLWSAVVNLKETSTMQDLKNLAKHFKDKYGFQCYQIAIHRDEGHIDENGNVIINHHAHLEFVTLDENTGKSLFRGNLQRPRALGQMQTEVAQILGMERGQFKNDTIDENGNLVKGTGRKRIEPRAYAQLMEQEKGKHQKVVQGIKEGVYKVAKKVDEVTANINNRLTESFEIIGLDALDTLNAQIKIETQNEKDIVKVYNTKYDTWINCINDNLHRYKADSLEHNILKTKHAQTEQDNQKLERANKTLEQEKLELKQDYQDLETAIVDLASIIEQGEQERNPSPHLDKKLTAKELTALCSNVRKYMIAVNAKFGELKLYPQKIYMAVNALKQQRLTITELKTKLIEIDKQAKADYEALQEQYKDYLSPKQVQDKINSIVRQYEKHLSPEQVVNKVEVQRLKDFKSLCSLAGIDSKDISQEADEAKKSLETSITQFKTDLTAFCERAGGGKWQTPKYAKEGLEKGIDKLKEQADKAETAQTAKTSLETAINATYSALIDPKEQKSDLAAQAKLKAIADQRQEQENTISGLNDTIRIKDKALEDMEALKTTNAKQAEQLKKVETLKTALQELKDKCDTLADDLTNKSDVITQAIESVQALQTTNAKQAEQIKTLEKAEPKTIIKQDDTALNNLKREKGKLQDRLLGLKEKYGLKAKRIKGLRADLSKVTNEVGFLTLASNEQKSQIKTLEAKQDQTYNALKRSRDRYKAMRATNKGLVTELAEAQKPKEPNKAPQTQDVPKQEDIAPNPLQAEYDALKGQYGALEQEKAGIALKLDNLEKNLPLLKDIDKDLAYLLQEVTKIAEINPKEASEAFDDILRYVDERKRSAEEEISMQASQQKDSGGYHI